MDQAAIIFKYFSELDAHQRDQINRLGPLYTYWNERVNLISRKDITHFYERHVLHSLGIAKVLNFVPGSKILDVGTGGGFPGVPLAIFFPACDFILIDATGKKIKVVEEVVKEIGIKNVKPMHIRADEVKGTYDFVVSRAVTRLKPFTEWVLKKINNDHRNILPNGILALKGGDLTEELSEVGGKPAVYNLGEYFKEEFFETKKLVHLALGSKGKSL